MRKLLLAIISAMVFCASPAYSVDSLTIKETLAAAEQVDVTSMTDQVEVAIHKIVEVDSTLQKRLTNKKIDHLAEAIAKASKLTGVDWKLILAISYVESRICLNVKGDKKPDKNGLHLYDYWSVGCMQVNLRWWGNAVEGAGLQQQDLLDYEKSILIGALILKYKVDLYGWTEGIKRYNGIGRKADAYRTKVLKIYNLISA